MQFWMKNEKHFHVAKKCDLLVAYSAAMQCRWLNFLRCKTESKTDGFRNGVEV